MRTVKEVAELTGVSIRTLQYYDEIGVFKPTGITEAGYRLYDDESLETLQQILFFKELDFSLKDIKEIMETPGFNKIEAFKKQRELIKVKCDRLNGLLSLLEKLEKGESCMSFKEFDLSEYLQELEQFKYSNMEEVIKYWGSIDEFERFVESVSENETEVSKMAVKCYGSVEKYTAAMKENLNHFSENMEKLQSFRPMVDEYVEKNKLLTERLTEDVTKDVKSKEVQDIVKEIMALGADLYSDMNMGDNYWNMVIDGYYHNAALIEANDKIFGVGASEFMGKAFQYYFEHGNGV